MNKRKRGSVKAPTTEIEESEEPVAKTSKPSGPGMMGTRSTSTLDHGVDVVDRRAPPPPAVLERIKTKSPVKISPAKGLFTSFPKNSSPTKKSPRNRLSRAGGGGGNNSQTNLLNSTHSQLPVKVHTKSNSMPQENAPAKTKAKSPAKSPKRKLQTKSKSPVKNKPQDHTFRKPTAMSAPSTSKAKPKSAEIPTTSTSGKIGNGVLKKIAQKTQAKAIQVHRPKPKAKEIVKVSKEEEKRLALVGATAEQEKHTNNCRQMREGLVIVISNFHEELLKRKKPNSAELVDSLSEVWKKYPLMFASPSKLPKVPVEDLSCAFEIRDFMPWWLHGLGSLLFAQELKSIRYDLKNLLKTFAQFLTYGNPDLAEVAFLELLQVLRKFTSKNPKKRVARLRLEFENREPMEVSFGIDDTNFEAIPDFLEVIREFCPRVFYFRHTQRQVFVNVLRKLWPQLDESSKSRFILTLLPVFAIIPPTQVPTENSVVKFLGEILQEGVKPLDPRNQHSFHLFCTLISKGEIPLEIFPESFLLKLHHLISKMIVSKEFNCILFENQRKCLIEVYSSLTKTGLNGDQALMLRSIDMDTFLRAVQTQYSFKKFHPLMEDVIVRDLMAAFTPFDPRILSNYVDQSCLRPIRDQRVLAINAQTESTLWNQIATYFDLNTLLLLGRDYSSMISTLKKFCFTIQLASKVNARLSDFISQANCESSKNSVLWMPDFKFLTVHQMVGWTDFVGKCLVQSFCHGMGNPDEILSMILETMKEFSKGRFIGIKLPISVYCQWAAIAGLPWFSKFKDFLPKRFLPNDFLVGINFTALDGLHASTKAECLQTLALNLFVHWKDFVVEIVSTGMESFSECQSITVLLEMIKNLSWPIRHIPFKYVMKYINWVTKTCDWRMETQMRINLGGAIVKMPCLHGIQEKRAYATREELTPLKRIQMDFESCAFCAEECINPSLALTKEIIPAIVSLALPLLKSEFLLVKLELCKLINAIRSHSSGYCEDLIGAFASTAALGKVTLGCEIMKEFGNYFARNSEREVYSEVALDRKEGIQFMFESFDKFLADSHRRRKSVRFSTKVLIILLGLAPKADQFMTIEILKYGMKLVTRIDNNVMNILNHQICGALASKVNLTPWELMTKLRYELTPEVLCLMLSICDFEGEDRPMQKERLLAFLHSIDAMGDFKRRAVFAHYYYPVMVGFLVPTLHEDSRHEFILKTMAQYAHMTCVQILQEGFHNYYRELVLNHSSERVTKCFSFLKENFGLDPNFLASNVLQTTLNEMICHLDERKDKVVKFVPQLLQRDGSLLFVAKNVPRSEIQELLGKHLMAFFVFVDTKLHSRIESVTTKRRILRSFTVLIEIMGKVRMTNTRSKVYATLNSLFSLGVEFHDLLFESWKVFVYNLENRAFGQMSAPICAAILVLRDTLPLEVDNLICHFVCSKAELTKEYHEDHYFILDYTKDENVIKMIKTTIDELKADSWVSYFEMLVRDSSHENSHIRLRALKKLHDVLLNEHEKLQEEILDREHPIVSQVLNSFLNASRDADQEMLMILAKSFGNLGAVDPYRFKDPKGEEIKRKSVPTLTCEGANFAAKYLDLLIREFQEAEDTTDFDYCACLIQQLLKHFNVQALETDPVWYTISRGERELVEPLLTTKYQVEKELPKAEMSCPIYLSENGKVFGQWLSSWINLMMTYVKVDSSASQLFQFSKYMIPRNNKIASFLLPFVTTYAVIGGTELQKLEIIKEMRNILQKWKDQDALKINSQLFSSMKESQTDDCTPELEPKPIFEEDVMQYRCTQEIFAVFDHLFRTVRAAKRQIGLAQANKVAKRQSVEQIKPCLTEEEANTIKRLLSQVPMSMVSQVAFYCEDYKRALFYAELDLKKYPEKLQETLSYLQQLYVSLNDLDSVVGVAKVREREATMSEIVVESFASGKVEAGVRSLELMTAGDPNDLIGTHGLLQAYLSVDEPRKAETLLRGCISRNAHWEEALHEFQIEAAWKLRDWSTLRAYRKESSDETSLVRTVSTFSVPEVAPSWNMTIVKILSFVQDLELDEALKILQDTRVKLMSPLVAAANDYNAYTRGYPNIVQLHILTEVEQMVNLLKQSGEIGFSSGSRIKDLLTLWDSRLGVLLKSQKFTEPVLNVRKTLLEKLKSVTNPDGAALGLLNGSILDCWLTVARVESKAGNFTRAQNCIVEAKKFSSAKVMIEHAKLLFRKGDKEEGIQILQSGIPNFFPRQQLEEWRMIKSVEIKEYSEEQKVASKALLLYASLCDEQQLLDIEMNIKNYKNAIDVYEKSEKNYFTLGSYYDRIWNNKTEEKDYQSDRQALVVKFYSMSLHYGCKYVYQSLPRLLSIWFDYASIGYNSTNGGKHSAGSSMSNSDSQPLEWSQTVQQMQTSIKNLLRKVPTYVLLTAFSQLISRLCHGNPIVWDLLKDILGTIICNHPHQAMWMTMAVSKSSYEMRKERCMDIYKSVERKKAGLKRTINDYTMLADRLIDLCTREIPRGSSRVSLGQACPNLIKLLNAKSFGDVLVPFQVFMSPSLPPKGTGPPGYNAFPQKFVYVRGATDQVEIMHSLVRPKKITLIGSNGKRYGLLCKAKDDLRKDCKVMEVNNVVNWYLHKNPESRQRQLNVRIYAVTPLNEEHGLLEWVPNLCGFRGCIMSLHRERGISLPLKDLKNVIRSGDSLHVKKQKFQKHFIEPYPTVFSEWFLNNFNDPQSWYKARMSYIRTAAVMSIVGYIFGLGDRHGENILLDSSTGDIVHVDFNCLFNKGETFDTPERVPFRLTQNMEEAMGPLGVEGIFRRSCEITMSMIREHKNIFLSVLRPFVFDPLVEWENTSGMRHLFHPTGETSNVKAVEHMKHIQNRINGTARNFTKETNSELSVEAQVAYLIDEARSADNLCRMFIGWTAFI